jgi:hypothetical protein
VRTCLEINALAIRGLRFFVADALAHAADGGVLAASIVIGKELVRIWAPVGL